MLNEIKRKLKSLGFKLTYKYNLNYIYICLVLIILKLELLLPYGNVHI